MEEGTYDSQLMGSGGVPFKLTGSGCTRVYQNPHDQIAPKAEALSGGSSEDLLFEDVMMNSWPVTMVDA